MPNAYPGKNCLVTFSGTAASFSTGTWTSADDLVYQAAPSSEQGQPLKYNGTYVVSTTSGTLPSTAYSLNRLNGSVIFATTASRNLTVVGSYLPVDTVSEAHAFTVNLSAANNDVTRFQDDWVRRIQGLKDLTGTIEDFHSNISGLNRMASTEDPLAVSIHIASTASYDMRFYAFFSADDISSSVDGVVEGSFGFEGTADLENRLVSFSTRGSG